ncbi:hypothetical protein NQ318_006986 [Aromia moschata]|uniref:Uncharacterized protein n=1 Tax=Aromia moschata TaxID=1265417 RepID=A0AAV8X492_9CUCU|nr:hypothetical protein NQ318_006986 [Aromia moschata]
MIKHNLKLHGTGKAFSKVERQLLKNDETVNLIVNDGTLAMTHFLNKQLFAWIISPKSVLTELLRVALYV